MGANRQIIYMTTRSHNFNWKEEEIKEHYNDLVDLLNKSEQILDI